MKQPDRQASLRHKKALTNTKSLIDAGLVDEADASQLHDVEENFSIRMTPHVIEQIAENDTSDPVYAQYVPSTQELNQREDELGDPIGDAAFEKVKGVTHRYPDRVLLKPTHTCHIYCRFCFRREKVGHPEAALGKAELDDAFGYIRDNDNIWEVILSGGDPLVLSDRRLGELMATLGAIEHVSVIRFHTRAPLVEPDRITDTLIEALKRAGKAVHFVIHVNHANELTAPVKEGLAKLVDNGIPLYSQSVLLKGINDDAAILAMLFRTLVACRVKPYYLHHLDKARGVNHFRVSIARGQEIMQELRGRISGLCQPTYVLDIPGGHGKIPIGPTYLIRHSDGGYTATDYLGQSHDYPEDGWL